MKQKKLNIAELVKQELRRKALGLALLCDCDFAHDNGENSIATNYGKNYVERFEKYRKDGRGLLLYGPSGCGKTYLAAEIVNALTDRGYRCRYTSMLTIMNTLPTLSPDSRLPYLNELCSLDLLVLDDFGKEAETSNSSNILNLIVNTCHEKKIPMIISTPYQQDNLVDENAKSKRIYSIQQMLERCLPLVLPMPSSRRAEKMKERREAEAGLKKGMPCPPEQQKLPLEENDTKKKEA